MNAVAIKAEFAPATDFLARKREEARTALLGALLRAGQDYEADILAFQWGGRKPDDTGLNRRTGNLHNSLQTSAEKGPRGISMVVSNHDARYWYWHDKVNGLGARLRNTVAGRRTKVFVVNHSRTNIVERFETVGRQMAFDRSMEALRMVCA